MAVLLVIMCKTFLTVLFHLEALLTVKLRLENEKSDAYKAFFELLGVSLQPLFTPSQLSPSVFHLLIHFSLAAFDFSPLHLLVSCCVGPSLIPSVIP